MKRKAAVILAVVMLAGLFPPATVAQAIGGVTIEVSQPFQVTADAHYERGQSIIYDGTHYWLFYGRSATVTGNYNTDNPDTHDYAVYYKKAASVFELASATAVPVPGATGSYLGETGAAYDPTTGEVWCFATVDVGPTAELYAWWTADDGDTWTQVEGPIVTGLSDGQAHHDEVWFSGRLWVLTGSGAFEVISSDTPKAGSWTSPVQVGAMTGGLGHFFVDGSELYLALASGKVPYIYLHNPGTDQWNLVDQAAPTPRCYDPTLFKVGSDYVFVSAPYEDTGGGWQYLLAWSGDTLDSSFFDDPEQPLWVSEANYKGNYWVDMWPIGFTDAAGQTYLLFTSERDPSRLSEEGTGNIWCLPFDWDPSRDHFTTIQGAVGHAADHDVVEVAAGTYYENAVIDNAYLSLLGEDAVINGQLSGHCIAVHADGVTVEGFELTNGYTGIAADTGASYCTFADNIIHANRNVPGYVGVGIMMWGDCDHNTIIGNTIYDNDRQGIFIGYENDSKVSSGNLIADNVIYDNGQYLYAEDPDRSQYGIQLWNAHDNTISHNTVYGHTNPDPDPNDPHAYFWGHALYLCQSGENSVSGNDFYGNTYGITTYDWDGDRCASNSIDSNLIHDNTGQGVWVLSGGDTLQLSGNQFYGNGCGVTASGPLDAAGNWWGSPNGPSHDSNCFNVGAQGDAVSDGVNFVPWLDAAPPEGDSFAPVVTSAPAGYFASVQAAVDASNPGGSVDVSPGVFAETLTFGTSFATDGLTVRGVGGERPVIAGGVLLTNSSAINGLTLRNLYIKGDAGANRVICMTNSGAVNDFVMDECVVDGENVPYRCGMYGSNLGESFTMAANEFKNILGWAVMDITAAGDGDSDRPLTTVAFAGNSIHDCNGSVALRGCRASPTTVVNAYGNTFTNIGGNEGYDGEQWAALEINTAVTVNIHDNYVEDVALGGGDEGQALQLWNIDTVDVHHNTFIDCAQGIWIYGGGTYAVPEGRIHHNIISGNLEYGLRLDPTALGGPLDARENWWGHASGPYHETLNQAGLGDEVSGNVDFEPWDPGLIHLTAPAMVRAGSSAEVEAWLSLSDGTLIEAPTGFEFTATRGSIDSPVLSVDGYAETTWQAPSGSRRTSISAAACGLAVETRILTHVPAPPPPPPEPEPEEPEEPEEAPVTIEVPESIYPEPVTLTISPADSPPDTAGFQVVGDIYDIELTVAATGDPVEELEQTLTIVWHFTEDDLAEAGVSDPALLRIWYWDLRATPPCWVALPTVVDAETGTLTAVVSHLTPFAVMVDPHFPPLPDAPGHWAEESILRLASLGAVSGYEDGTFRPEVPVTRAQFAKFLVSALGVQEGTAIPAGFSDAAEVPSWAVPYVAACVREGILTGSGGLLRPQATITRAEAATMLVRALDLPTGESGPLMFADVDEIPAWAYPFVYQAVHKGLMSGLPGNLFDAGGTLTRAQAVTILDRALDID